MSFASWRTIFLISFRFPWRRTVCSKKRVKTFRKKVRRRGGASVGIGGPGVGMGIFDFLRRKTPASSASARGADPKKENVTRHCFVLCKGAGPGDLSKAKDVVAQVFGPGYSAEVTDGEAITVIHGKETVGFL